MSVAEPAAGSAVPAVAGRDEVPPWVGWVTSVAVVVVAAAAAVASVDHLAELARLAGTGGWRSYLLPAALDGLVVASSMCLYRAHLLGRRPGFVPWFSLGVGLSTSVAGNVLSVYPELAPESWLKIGVGAAPPIALALAVEEGLRQIRST